MTFFYQWFKSVGEHGSKQSNYGSGMTAPAIFTNKNIPGCSSLSAFSKNYQGLYMPDKRHGKSTSS
ncbi:MAG: hypothetical protein U0Y08_07705 [Bacteroidia bacterium]